jgi:hypothetical protein
MTEFSLWRQAVKGSGSYIQNANKNEVIKILSLPVPTCRAGHLAKTNNIFR